MRPPHTERSHPLLAGRLHKRPGPVVVRRTGPRVEALLHAIGHGQRRAGHTVNNHVRAFTTVQVGDGAVCPHHRAVVSIVRGIRPRGATVVTKGIATNRRVAAGALLVVQDGLDDLLRCVVRVGLVVVPATATMV